MTNSMSELREALAINLGPTGLLESLGADTIAELAAAARTATLNPGDLLFPEGAGADALYIIREGVFHAIEPDPPREPRLVRILGPGDVVDGVLELAGDRMPVSVHATGPAVVTIIPGDAIDRLVAVRPDLRALRDRLHKRELLVGLSRVFGPIDGELLAALEAEADWMNLQRGEVLWEPGSPSDGLFFVISGRLAAYSVQPDGSEQLEQEMGRGQTAGSTEFLDGRPRRYRVRATRDGLLVGYTTDEFERLIGQKPQIVRKITAGIVARTEGPPGGLRRGVTTIAILPASNRAPVSAFVQRLEKALSKFGNVLRLDQARVEQLLTEPGIAQAKEDSPEEQQLLAWLDACESRNRFVIFEVDPAAEVWAQRCIRRADRLLLVAAAGDPWQRGDRELAAVRLASSAPDTKTTLVLIHEDGSRAPNGTRNWLDARPEVSDHVHVRWDSNADIERVARVLAGRSIAVVLGGGGARGFAHIGLLRALAEQGIPVDAIGGNSMGASIASQHAMGRDADGIIAYSKKVFLEIKPHRGFTIPLFSVVSMKRVQLAGLVCYGEIDIEDLWLPFFCVSSNLTTAELMVHRRGTLWKAAHASACLPGIGAPVLHHKNLLVDGALLNNLPTDIMRRMGYGTVIASVVSVDESGTFTCERVPTPWEAFRGMFGDGSKKVRFPSIVEVVLRSSLLHSAHSETANAMQADLVVHPGVEQFGLLDFERINEIVDAGYLKTNEAITRWRDQASDLFN